jgi:hypothetical protein
MLLIFRTRTSALFVCHARTFALVLLFMYIYIHTYIDTYIHSGRIGQEEQDKQNRASLPDKTARTGLTGQDS